MPSVVVCSGAGATSTPVKSCCSPSPTTALDGADPVRLAAMPRRLPLVYIGISTTATSVSRVLRARAARFEHRVAGNVRGHRGLAARSAHNRPLPLSRTSGAVWVQRWRRCCCSRTIARAGQMTQRLSGRARRMAFITPGTIPSAACLHTPPALHSATDSSGRPCRRAC